MYFFSAIVDVMFDTPRGKASGNGVSATVGIVGAGQLARMTQQAAIALGINVSVLASAEDDAAAKAATEVHIGDPSDLSRLRDLASCCDVLTFDHELIPTEHLESLQADGFTLRPGPGAKRAAQDKLYGRRVLEGAGFPVPDYAVVRSPEAIESAGLDWGWPIAMKARQGGYDGRGVFIIESVDAGVSLLSPEIQWIAERHVAIERELSQLVARRPGGQVVAYPLIETVQQDGICVEARAPAAVDEAVASRCAELACEVGELIDATGVMAVELFLDVQGEILVNELALRPHNSGHLTIEACQTSQFENHLRAVLDWPLGSTALRSPAAVMTNVLGATEGDPATHVAAALEVEGARPHLYGKSSRLGRKIGHVTAIGQELEGTAESSRRCAAILGGAA